MAWQQPKTTWGQAGQTVPGVADFNRIEENIRILGEYNRAPGYGTATGINAKTITLNPAPGSYYDGLCFAFKNITENTGAVTINVNGLGARPIKKPNGNDLASGALRAGSIYTIRYNSNTGNFILQGEGGEYGTAQPEHVLEGYTIGTEEGVKPGTMPNVGLWAQLLTKHHEYIYIPKGYHNGGGVVAVEIENMSADKIKFGEVVGGVVGTLDLKYQHLYLNNSDGESVDVVLGEIPAYGTKYVDISVPAGRKAVILNYLYVNAYARPPWTGKFNVWNGRVFLKSIQVIDDTTWELKFENEYEYSQGCGSFYMHIFYV